nr:MAG TPA: hypothetical protein [Caudoviricetes sp.]
MSPQRAARRRSLCGSPARALGSFLISGESVICESNAHTLGGSVFHALQGR